MHCRAAEDEVCCRAEPREDKDYELDCKAEGVKSNLPV